MGVDLVADGDEVGGELFAGGGGEAGSAASVFLSGFLNSGGFDLGEGRRSLRFTIADISFHFLDGNLGLDLFFDASTAHLNTHYVTGDPFVPSLFVLVADDENHVEAGEDGGLKIDVFPGRLEVVVASEDWIRGREDRCSGVEDGRDAGFGDRDGLLFHGFVDGDSVLVSHLVEFVDADDAAVGEDHGSAFEVEFSGVGVSLD